METGNLYIEEIPREEKHFCPPVDYGHRKRSKAFRPGNFYPIPSIENRTSRSFWLGNKEEVGYRAGVRVVFKAEEKGALKVWDSPEEQGRFVIGAVGAIDAENKYSIATALNLRTLTQPVELAVNLPPDLFAIEIFKLAIWLNCIQISFERSDTRHGLTIQQALISGNRQHNVIGCSFLLHLDRSLDKVQGKDINKYGFEIKEENRGLFIDNLIAATREEKVKLNSERLIKELQIPNLIEEGHKVDWANRAYAMAICYELARLNPYKKPVVREERKTLTQDNI